MASRKWWAAAVVAVLALVVLAGCGSSGGSSGTKTGTTKTGSKPTLTVAAPECAHCLAMTLLGSQLPQYNVQFKSFATLTELTAGLASGSIDVGQIDYTGLVSFISKGLPIVAVSGEVNGGSDFVVSPKITLTSNDWPAFAALVKKDKAAGHKFTIASQFGSVQDIEIRLELPKYGIDPTSDLTMINVPYQGMAQALHNGSADAAVPVQPFAASILAGEFGAHFAYPYNQAAGNLTNVVVMSKSFLAKHAAEATAIVKGMSTLVPYLKTATGQKAWAGAVEKYTKTSPATVTAALAQLIPQLTMPLTQIDAVAKAMYDQKLIASPLSKSVIAAAVDYTPLVTATGQTASALGST